MLAFQSPSRWGRCCFLRQLGEKATRTNWRFSPLLDGDGVASWELVLDDPRVVMGFSPLLDGDGVASTTHGNASYATLCRCFSPLLDGDGVASCRSWGQKCQILSFSPLLDGDGVASMSATKFAPTLVRFSPLLDGDGVASALELSHSTAFIAGLRAHFRADEVSAPKRARSANSLITTRLRNSLRTRIPRTASSRL